MIGSFSRDKMGLEQVTFPRIWEVTSWEVRKGIFQKDFKRNE